MMAGLFAPVLPSVSNPVDQTRRAGKQVMRKVVLARRDALPVAVRAGASETIAMAAVTAIGELPTGSVVALYAAKGSEVDTAALDAHARARGWVVAYPRVVAGSRVLVFHAAGIDELVTVGGLGLREPAVGTPAVSIGDIAAFVIPGIAFDRKGGRVGWGRGHYDATLATAAVDVKRVGLAFECQLIDHVPDEDHDVGLDIICTEAATYRVDG